MYVAAFVFAAFLAASPFVSAQDAPKDVIPHNQDQAPGPALSPAEAIKKMTVPPGFSVEVVASEPNLVNPVAMTFDERGRVWVTESLEYPRLEAGEGRDRIKILEDTNNDGVADKFTIFAEGLNIPSGIAVGYGGVWVANAPDILFLKDTDGDDKADSREVVATGFGRFDTHELPNSLTWGPDGWLYGLNGVFNHSEVKSNNGETYKFTCAVFRIHPRTREFQVWAEGTSNPWGIALNSQGSMFLSACVIDHLWHIVESGYYHRQAGAYPPFTWKINSIVNHTHQKAAYCGIHYFDSDAYPAEFRDKLYMGNIHGGCVNSDVLEQTGSTYFARPAPDFLTANDAWFMPVSQKTGPDGCLYVLDWYDRYHCYQDARRDSEGIDRLKGRLYRVRHGEAARPPAVNLAKESDDQLIARLNSPNVYFRDTAQRLLAERATKQIRSKLRQRILSLDASPKERMHATWAFIGAGELDPAGYLCLLTHVDPVVRTYGVRAAGDDDGGSPAIIKMIGALASDKAPEVRLQVAIAAPKIADKDAVPLLLDVLANSPGDRLIPHIVWQNLYPLMEENTQHVLDTLAEARFQSSPAVLDLLPRVVERVLGTSDADVAPIAKLVERLGAAGADESRVAAGILEALAEKFETREVTGEQAQRLRSKLEPLAAKFSKQGARSPLFVDAVLLRAAWQDAEALKAVEAIVKGKNYTPEARIRAVAVLSATGDEAVVDLLQPLYAAPSGDDVVVVKGSLAALGRLPSPRVADLVLTAFGQLSVEDQVNAVDLLVQRADWSKRLLEKMGAGEVPKSVLNASQARSLLALKDAELAASVEKHWGTVRNDRDPKREQVIAEMRDLLQKTPGNAERGATAFKKLCAQCHKIHGQGEDVGPDLTNNGRNSFEQLLSNVFDPSLVIGRDYQPRTVVTTDGRVLSGLVVEESRERVVLKLQGAKLETIPRGLIEDMQVSPLSLMPEGVEKQYTPQEIADLFTFLLSEKPLIPVSETAH